VVDLGGLPILEYTTSWTKGEFETVPTTPLPSAVDTVGPDLRFGAVLFIEKEGFAPILEDAGIAERYDISIMSPKGIPNIASCEVSQKLYQAGVTVFVLHDFDYDGFKIVKNLRRGVRLAPGTKVIDLGFRLEDIEGLQSEEVWRSGDASKAQFYLNECGATNEESGFLVQGGSYSEWHGRRVELNAMTSDQLIDWLERKLDEHGVKKVVPEGEVLEKAYRRAIYLQRCEQEMDKFRKEFEEKKIEVPAGLKAQLEETLATHQRASWDQALWNIAKETNGDIETEVRA